MNTDPEHKQNLNRLNVIDWLIIMALVLLAASIVATRITPQRPRIIREQAQTPVTYLIRIELFAKGDWLIDRLEPGLEFRNWDDELNATVVSVERHERDGAVYVDMIVPCKWNERGYVTRGKTILAVGQSFSAKGAQLAISGAIQSFEPYDHAEAVTP